MHWESRNSSFKPFPAAHVLHPYVSALLRLRAARGASLPIARIECPVAEFNVSIVCEPAAEKCAPATQAHCRVCLQYTMAEALLRKPGQERTATRCGSTPRCSISRGGRRRRRSRLPGPGRFKGAVRDAEGRACSRRLKSTTAARRRTR